VDRAPRNRGSHARQPGHALRTKSQSPGPGSLCRPRHRPDPGSLVFARLPLRRPQIGQLIIRLSGQRQVNVAHVTAVPLLTDATPPRQHHYERAARRARPVIESPDHAVIARCARAEITTAVRCHVPYGAGRNVRRQRRGGRVSRHPEVAPEASTLSEVTWPHSRPLGRLQRFLMRYALNHPAGRGAATLVVAPLRLCW
jgi:hypothetical protein